MTIFLFCKVHELAERYSSALLFGFGIFLLSAGLQQDALAQTVDTWATPDYNDGLVRIAVCNMLSVIEGAMGALVMVVAGIGAIIAAAMGAYRLGVSLLVVAIGSFILRSLVSIFFGDFPDCVRGGTVSAPSTTVPVTEF